MTEQTHALLDSIQRIDDYLASAKDKHEKKVPVRDLLDMIGHRSFGAFLLFPALVELSPLGGIPGVPTIIALFLAATAVQLFLCRDHVWVPSRIERMKVSPDKLTPFLKRLRPVARFVDRKARERFSVLLKQGSVRAAAVCILALCLIIPPLELIPFASSIPVSVIALFGLALLVGDGLLMAIAYILFAAAGIAVFFVMPGI